MGRTSPHHRGLGYSISSGTQKYKVALGQAGKRADLFLAAGDPLGTILQLFLLFKIEVGF